MANDWEEVKKLAADFQLTQTAATLQRLSERNCVEIVKKLAQLNLLEVIYTSDGKEYLTPEHLTREIEDELYAAGGRIGFNELASQLNVDISHIEVKAKECARLSGSEIVYIGDELINKNYKEQLAVEINERIQKRGTLDIGDLTRIYSLSADFLHQIITSHLGTVINAVQDPNNRLNFFTKSYLDQYRAKITGVLSAVTRPVSISHLINKYAFPEKMFNNVIDELIRTGRVNGQLTTGSNRTFIPNIYLLTQKEWIENFYKHNGYLEYDALARVGITEPRALKKRSGFEDLILLSTCCVGQSIFVQVEGALDDCLASKSWMNLADVLPSFLDEDDMKKLIDEYKNCFEDKASTFITLNKTLVISHQFVSESLESLVEACKAKAERDLKDGVLFRIFASSHSAKDKTSLDTKSAAASRKEERKRRGGTKTFSTQGREVKTKSVKKKYKPNQKFDDSDASDNEESLDAPGSVDVSDLLEELHKRIDPDREHDSEIVDMIAENMVDSVRSKYLDIAREYFANSLTKDSSAQKKTQADLQQAINTLYANINVFWKSLKLFDDELSASLSKYLLRSLCSELVDNAILLVLDDSKKSEKLVFPLTIESRSKLISKLEPNYRDSFTALNATLTESSVENFFTKLEETFEVCDIMIKKLDKKRESVLMSELRQNIILQINEANQSDYPLILHLSTLLLLWSVKQCMVHASGKFVPQILASLKTSLPSETYDLFHSCEQLIVKMVKAGKEGPEVKEEIEKKLAELIPSVKAIALNFPPQS